MTDLKWFKSSYSDSGGECIEVAHTAHIHIRDSKAPSRPYLTVSPAAWADFLTLASKSERRSGHSSAVIE
ncbi:DUF397 domain-containing protein [Streptomyces sp. NPDC047079]|uniref:DUF397 domain-containing protein n=1 Tax=Streptomyces sp. NPDC047079 TaxID=3154607 RepID=UPI00340B2D37